ncbi:hypothetical protein K4L06_10700 [Lysobacter sp. BMK333-48F3]|uniref:hypothetical protein n=1 Tax=Lysobacter sp. BMK333-48F3 TaxID=2867962 RepID=UPI001C8C9178|nr:hypothetical protein [Lysobacter sp. BMK333-48F3]MBX9401782.1 hypothetical protein [Lysobacter sp. BMK333-48F3]
MKGKLLTLFALLLPSASALAGQCEDNFTKSGNPLKGTEYSTTLKVPGLAVPSAIAQMHNIAIEDGMNIIDESVDAGSMLLEVSPNVAHRGLQVYFTAAAGGETKMLLKTRRGSLASADSIKTSMCKMLYQLKAGKAPVTKSASNVKPIAISAIKLGDQVTQTLDDNAGLIDSRFKGKTYRISGYFLGSDSSSSGMDVFYDMTPSLLPGFVASESDKIIFTRVMCRMAKDQRGYALGLRKGDKLDLIGTFADYQPSNRAVIISNCRTAK